MLSTEQVPDTLVVDHGPVFDAALILVERSTLCEHVHFEGGEFTTTIGIHSPIPFDLWGSGTQALWRLLAAIAYTRYEVSLYEVVSRLDRRNSAAVADALAALCEVSR